MNKAETKQVLMALKKIDAELRAAWNSRLLPTCAISAACIHDYTATITLCEASLARVVEPVGEVVSSGPSNLPIFQWLSADHSFRVPIGSKLYADTPQEAAAQSSQAVELSADDVRTAGGIVHSDGNVFFTNIAKLNAAINAKVST